jgi:hypothetical protein
MNTKGYPFFQPNGLLPLIADRSNMSNRPDVRLRLPRPSIKGFPSFL